MPPVRPVPKPPPRPPRPDRKVKRPGPLLPVVPSRPIPPFVSPPTPLCTVPPAWTSNVSMLPIPVPHSFSLVVQIQPIHQVAQMTKGLLNSLYCWSVCAVCTFNRALCSCTYSQGSAPTLTFTGNVKGQPVNSVFFFKFPVGIRVGHHAETMGQHLLKGVLQCAQAGAS